MAMPINMDFKGGSSEAKSTTTLGETGTGGGGGVRGITLNIASGGSKQAASTGAGIDTQTLLIGGGIALGVFLLLHKRKG